MPDLFKHFALSLLCVFAAIVPLQDTHASVELKSNPQAWVVMDGLSGFVVEQSNSQTPINPGELVHLMTLLTALEIAQSDPQLERMQEPVTFAPEDGLHTQTARRIYLIGGESAPLETLLHSIAVLGAHDAILAVSRHLAGSHEEFVARMNATAHELGMQQSHFTSALAADDQISCAHDLALATRALFQRHPQAFAWLKEKEFSFSGYTQRNRNVLLWKDDNIGGVMSSADGTSLIGSWHRLAQGETAPRHIFAIVLQGEQSEAAANDILALLRVARVDYETVRLFAAHTPIKSIDILTGNRDKLTVGSPTDIWITVSRQAIASRGTGGFSAQFKYLAPAIAPVQAGQTIGTLSVEFDQKPIAEFPLQALHDVGSGSFLSRFVDSVRLRIKPSGASTDAPDSQKNASTSSSDRP